MVDDGHFLLVRSCGLPSQRDLAISYCPLPLPFHVQYLAEEHARECAKGPEEIELDERKWMEAESNDPM